MTAFLFVALTALLLEDNHFGAAFVLEDAGCDGCALNCGLAKLDVAAFPDRENGVDGYRVTVLGFRITVDEENISLLDGKLSSLCFDRGFHRKKRPNKDDSLVNARRMCMRGSNFIRALVRILVDPQGAAPFIARFF